MKRPCPSCPWRLTTRSKDIPGSGGIMGPAGRQMCDPDSTKAMACHLGTDTNVIPCAGFVIVVGRDNIGLRLAALMGLIRFEEYGTDAPLYPSMREMMAAHPDPEERA